VVASDSGVVRSSWGAVFSEFAAVVTRLVPPPVFRVMKRSKNSSLPWGVCRSHLQVKPAARGRKNSTIALWGRCCWLGTPRRNAFLAQRRSIASQSMLPAVCTLCRRTPGSLPAWAPSFCSAPRQNSKEGFLTHSSAIFAFIARTDSY